VVPGGTIFPLPSKGIIEKEVLEQIVCDCAVVTEGTGLTVII
jgi:hypothetical protein